MINLVIYRIYSGTPNERFYSCTDLTEGSIKYLSTAGRLYYVDDGGTIQFCNSKRDMIRFIKRYFANVNIELRL